VLDLYLDDLEDSSFKVRERLERKGAQKHQTIGDGLGGELAAHAGGHGPDHPHRKGHRERRAGRKDDRCGCSIHDPRIELHVRREARDVFRVLSEDLDGDRDAGRRLGGRHPLIPRGGVQVC